MSDLLFKYILKWVEGDATNFIGYDPGKIFALEEFYAGDLEGYSNALAAHPNHNYYFGRNTPTRLSDIKD